MHFDQKFDQTINFTNYIIIFLSFFILNCFPRRFNFRFKNSRNSIDAQTISTFDSSGDQSGFYRNYKESWENLKYVRHANSYKPGSGLSRLDAFDTAYRNPRSRNGGNGGNGGGGNGTIGVGGLCNEGFRDTGEITLNADVAALYSRPDKRFRGQY